MTEQTRLGRRVWEFLGHISLIHWLCSVPLAFLVTWASRKWNATPPTADPIAAVAAAGAVFFGTLAFGVATSKTIAWSIPRIKHRRFPHSIRVTAEGGSYNGVVTFTHVGAGAIWSVDGKIVRTLDGSTNPSPSLFECHIYKEGKAYRSIGLEDGEWAQITVANIVSGQFTQSYLAINQGGSDVSVSNAGVVIELIFRAEPKLKNGPIKKCLKIVRASMFKIEVTLLSGE